MPGKKKKKHEKDRKRILGEQFNDAPEKGEAREAHRLSRMLAGREIWEQEEGTCPGYPKKRMTERSDHIAVDQNAIQQDTETGNACKPFACSIPADLLKILVVPEGGRGTNTAIGIAQNGKEVKVNVVGARGGGSKSVQVELAQTALQGLLAGESKTKVWYLDGQLTWNIPSATETETRIAAAWNAWHMLGQFWKKKAGEL